MRVLQRNHRFRSLFIKTPQIKFFFTTLMACTLTRKSAPKSKQSPLQRMSQKFRRQFLGIIQFMAPFISKLADQTAPVRALTKKDVPFEWNSSLQKVFQNVKASICKDIALTYFDVTKPTTIQVDASKIGIGAALLQDGRPIAFASKALTETEQRYANIERELLAIVFGCERFHTYVYGKPFVVETDHKPLEMIHKKALCG